ncbi:hypothetical protein [uncultured Maribacter sp.]|uniref:hypothetical protein n=1 Tax=uncultured Maribacter sp. TaxID=431308 RepID=UPI00262A558F|nr:hypothetical protein [uncultured Maribacter sp.]
MKYLMIILLILLSIISVYGQNKKKWQSEWKYGELILRNGDTLKGRMILPILDDMALTSSKKVKFQKSSKNKKTNYSHFDVKKIIIKNHMLNKTWDYQFVKISDSKYRLFELVYESDEIRLFKRKTEKNNNAYLPSPVNSVHGIVHLFDNNNVYNTRYYAQRKNEGIASILYNSGPFAKSFRKNGIHYFSDCPDLVSSLKNRGLNESDVLKIVKEFDKCLHN